MTVNEAVAKVTGDYLNEVARMARDRSELGEIAGIIDALDFESFDNSSDTLGYAYRGVIRKLSAAANELLSDPAEKDAVPAAVERWVRSNIGCMGPLESVLSAAWHYGPEEAEQKLRAELAQMFGSRYGQGR